MSDIKKRIEIKYNLKELQVIQKKKIILENQIELKEIEGINIIYPNQNKCGEEVKDVFNNKSIINCLVYGMTQTGKTGCMTSLIRFYILSNNIPIDNIYIITGLSDIEWKKDTKNRMPDSINSNIFHRANLPKKFLKDINYKKNCLIIMDEIQIACEESQTIFKTFKQCGFYDLDFLLKNDIKLIQFSATPDGNIADILDWGIHSARVKLEPGENYYGVNQALAQERVKQFKLLTCIDNVKELKKVIDDNYLDPYYHLIRVPSKRDNKIGNNNQDIVISNFETVFGNDYVYNKDYLKTKKDDINKLLKNKPEKHSFVFYCEILRCAKTQCKNYIGISYERFSNNIIDSTIIQGSFGRLTGYDDNGFSICYTNIASLKNYIELWNNDMEFKKGIEWNTKTTDYDKKDDMTYSSGTFNSVKYIDQLKGFSSHKIIEDRGEPNIKKFYKENGQEKMIIFFKENIQKKSGKRGPKRKKKDSNGFFKGAIRKGPEVLSVDVVNKEKRWGFVDGPSFRSYPCYEDVNDKDTLQWWMIWYE
jgi:hypothetical protein